MQELRRGGYDPIIEAHGGHVIAASPGKGQGSTFTIELPIV